MSILDLLLILTGIFTAAVLLSAFFFLYLFVYPFKISGIQITGGQARTVALKPTLRWRKSVSFKNSVHLGCQYFAVWTGADPSEGEYKSCGLSFFGDVYIFRKDILGRFKSVDLNDKFIKEFLVK